MQSLQPQKASACTETRHTMYRSLRSVLLVFEGKENSSVTTHLITVVKNDLLVPQPFPFVRTRESGYEASQTGTSKMLFRVVSIAAIGHV